MKKQSELRIGVLTHNYPVNAKDRKDAGVFIYDFCQELSKRAKVFVFCPDFGGIKEKYKRVPVTWFKWDNSNEKFGNWQLFNPLYVYKFFKLIYIGRREAIKFARENKLDYCLTCWTIPSAILGLQIKRALKIPYASWSLGSDVNKYVKIPILGQFIYLSLRFADVLYANSFALSKKVEAISGRNCNFMPAITNFELRKTVKVNIDKNVYNFLYVGRLEKVKGPDILIQAIKELSDRNVSFKINVLGGGSMEKELKKTTQDLNLKRYVNFVGWANEEMVFSYMKACDCLIIPSRNESLPLVMIEAARVGLPIIATDVGDCKRLVKDYNIGYIAESGNFVEIAEKMYMAIKKRRSLRLKSKNGLKKIANNFKQTKAVGTLLEGIDRWQKKY